MKITNLYNLPDAFTHLAEDGGRPPVPHVYHITELIEPVRMALLLRAHYDEITEDASDCVWLVFGQAAHKIMEEGNRKDYAEMPLSRECGTATVTGRLDLWDGETISDYKTSTVAKVQRQDFGDYFLQGHGLRLASAQQGQAYAVRAAAQRLVAHPVQACLYAR
jgi:hypothetical protein